MSKWSGKGIPPTRRKLHRWRKAQLLEKKAQEKAARQEFAGLDASYREIKRAILNPERFERMWT